MATKISTRDMYGETLVEIGKDEKIVVLDADVSTCTMSCTFGEVYPDRFFNIGIAEANMIGIAAGMATYGLKPFASTFSMFMAGRGFEQIRNSICYPRLNVKLVGTHTGLMVGEDGATHQCLEDIALMRSIPGMLVICPADGEETRQAILALANYEGPAYLRLGRSAVESCTDIYGYRFEIGRAVRLLNGGDVALFATGVGVEIAINAARALKTLGIEARVIDIHTIKPVDREEIIAAAKEVGAIVTIEDHNVIGGLGSAVSEVVTETVPVPVAHVGVQDRFGKSGSGAKLMELYGVCVSGVVDKAKEVIAQKNYAGEIVYEKNKNAGAIA